jgi:tellurite resistance protein
MRPPRVPSTFFGIPFGLAGLGDVWHVAAPPLRVSPWVAGSIYIAAAAVWVILLAGYLAQGWRQILADFEDPVLGAFVSLVAITPMLLAAALAPSAHSAARLLVIIFLVLTVVLGGCITGQWIITKIDEDANHPGYFLPTVAGPLVGAACAVPVGLHDVAEGAFGTGVISWLILGSILLRRLFFRPSLPQPLIPTIAIEVAPPAVAGIAYFAIDGVRVDLFARALGCYGILMAIAQLRLVPVYARLRFSPGFWSFTFSYAAVAVDAMLWLKLTTPPGATACMIVVVTLISVLIVAIAARSIVAIARGQFFPARGPSGPPRPPLPPSPPPPPRP